MQFLFLFLPTLGQELSSTGVTCDPGFLCIRERHCPRFLELKDQLSHLLNDTSETEHRDKLFGKLTKRVCNKSERGVCCKENLEVINGNTVNSIEDIPFIVRLKIKTSSWPYSYSICGASLIHSQFLLTAKHCLTTFYDQCLDESDCVAHFRDLVLGPTNHEPGQFEIPITEIYEHEGISDLAVVELKHRVEEHEDYNLGPPLHIIKLATEQAKPGDRVLTAGWGLTGYNEGPSEDLRSLELTTTRVWSRDVCLNPPN